MEWLAEIEYHSKHTIYLYMIYTSNMLYML